MIIKDGKRVELDNKGGQKQVKTGERRRKRYHSE